MCNVHEYQTSIHFVYIFKVTEKCQKKQTAFTSGIQEEGLFDMHACRACGQLTTGSHVWVYTLIVFQL